jgi:hypothetical protein
MYIWGKATIHVKNNHKTVITNLNMLPFLSNGVVSAKCEFTTLRVDFRF